MSFKTFANRPLLSLPFTVLILPGFLLFQPCDAVQPAVKLPTTLQGWKHSGSMFVLTTRDGANLPATALVEGFPLLVRLHKDFFDFTQAKTNGEDLRFSGADGKPLPFQIERWDAGQGAAEIWVRMPRIQGNTRQEIRLHWGNAAAASLSSGSSVFNESNGYLSVLHMNEPVRDEVGKLAGIKDVGTTASDGIVGKARHFAGKQGVFGGNNIATYPTGASSHTTEAWFRAEKPNAKIVAWGNEQAQGKVVMEYRSPPHMRMDCYFSNGNVEGNSSIPLFHWAHVAHTYQNGDSRLYVNGVLDASTKSAGPPLAIKSPARMYVGGWYDNYDLVGDMDEVRISRVARPAEWIKLQYENQKPGQTLVGPLVQPGDEFSVSKTELTLQEGEESTISAKAGGAQKIYWIVKRDTHETIVATDRFSFTLAAGRVVGDAAETLLFKAIYPSEVKTKEIPVTIKERIPEPVITLTAPTAWDGRQTIEIVPTITNLKAMQDQGAGQLHFAWNVFDLATIKEVAPDKLILKRAQGSGPMRISLAVDNGGERSVRAVTITVKEPAKDAWLPRTAAKDEKPEDNQFYARDDKNEGTLFYNGTLTEPADSVFLKLYADEKLVDNSSQTPAADKNYAFAVKLKPGLIKYKVEFGTKIASTETVLHTATNLVCGDAYLIDGQSNAEATAFGKEDYLFSSPWIRTFGSTNGSPQLARLKSWGAATARANDGKAQVGYWGLELARQLVENQQIPICIINGAVGGTRIDQHQRSLSDPEDITTIYGRLLWRVRQARLTHGIRGLLWHQGENDQGADGLDGGFGWETYRQYFINLAGAWKQDYPNIQHYYVFQIWPKACSMGINGSDNRLREVQRNLPTAFSNLSIMSTLGIVPPGTCHYPPAGYAEIARLICPLVERDNYGKSFPASVTAPNLQRASFTGNKKKNILLEFDQPVAWDDALAAQFYLDGVKGQVVSGAASGNILRLKLANPSTARKITYLDSNSWSQNKLLRGANGIAALTFCDVPISSH